MFNLGALQKALLKPLIPVIKISGAITHEQTAKVARSLKKVNTSRSKALAVVINSPGGSPVQSELICEKLKHFSHEHKLPLYTFAEDVAASGGYYILCIGDSVYVDPNSIVGSIGVVASSIFVKGAAEDNKIKVKNVASREDLLSYKFDPFREGISEEDKKIINNLLKGTHEDFINHVESYRKKKITLDETKRREVIYNADVFVGKKSVELGLADKLGNYQSVLFREFPDAKVVNVTAKTTAERYAEAMQAGLSFFKSEEALPVTTPEQQIKDFVTKYKDDLNK